MMTSASFRLFGDQGLTAEAVTSRLAITPTTAAEAGEPVSPRAKARRDSSLWLLRSAPEIEEHVELAEQLERLLDQLLPAKAALWDLVHEGYQANWFAYVASNPTEHAVELDRSLLARLLELPGDLWIDACGD
jgi:hypothetical protein